MRILIATDAWNCLNGVVTTLVNVANELEKQGHQVYWITPEEYSLTYPCPTYPEIRIPVDIWKTSSLIKMLNPDVIHIATEGSIGFSVRRYCLKNDIPFTTSYHTKFPEYIQKRFGFGLDVTYSYLKWFHKPSNQVLVTSQSMNEELTNKGFTNLVNWPRGVNRSLFKDTGTPLNKQLVIIYVGRVSIEKNIEAFLDLKLSAHKIVVGDGPEKERLEKLYPEVTWLGALTGKDLVNAYNSANVFVFPSKSDTYGIVNLEANACGLPIAAYPVTGPIDIVVQGKNGYLDNNLELAVLKCVRIDKKDIKTISKRHTWENCANIFLKTAIKSLLIQKTRI